jgi:hypothetical protein
MVHLYVTPCGFVDFKIKPCHTLLSFHEMQDLLFILSNYCIIVVVIICIHKRTKIHGISKIRNSLPNKKFSWD